MPISTKPTAFEDWQRIFDPTAFLVFGQTTYPMKTLLAGFEISLPRPTPSL
jgi:hypothetical protein